MGGLLMVNMSCIPPNELDLPVEMRHLRVAAYCRVSTEQEEQDNSIRLQELHCTRLINGNPNTEQGYYQLPGSGVTYAKGSLQSCWNNH